MLPFSSILTATSIPECSGDLLPDFSRISLTRFPSSQAGEASCDGPERDGYFQYMTSSSNEDVSHGSFAACTKKPNLFPRNAMSKRNIENF